MQKLNFFFLIISEEKIIQNFSQDVEVYLIFLPSLQKKC